MPNICRFCRRKLTPRPDFIKGVEIDTFSPPRWKDPFGGYVRACQSRRPQTKEKLPHRDHGNRRSDNRPRRYPPEAPCRKALLQQKAPDICNYPRLPCLPDRCTPVRSALASCLVIDRTGGTRTHDLNCSVHLLASNTLSTELRSDNWSLISHKLCVKAESLTCKAFYFQFYRRLAPGLVGSAGFEPTASCSQSKRSARLNYNPMESKSLATLARFTNAENSKKARKVSISWIMILHLQRHSFRSPIPADPEGWLRGMDLHHRPLGYEPSELLLLHRAIVYFDVILTVGKVKSQAFKNFF